MLGEGSVWMGSELSPQRSVLVRCDRGRAAWGYAWHQASTAALLRQQALNGAETDAEGLHNFPARHPALYCSQDALPQVNGVAFHRDEYAIRSVLMLTAVILAVLWLHRLWYP